jgi:tRNA(Ser,Leu) C12 N-acetylase TAN1
MEPGSGRLQLMERDVFRRLKSVSPIFRIVLTQATRHRAQQAISEAVFTEQIQRIAREELEPNGLTLLVRELPAGRIRFIIKEAATRAVCDLLEFAADGTLESDADEAVAESSADRG